MSALDLAAVLAGFDDPALGSQAAFRSALEALSHPGTLVACERALYSLANVRSAAVVGMVGAGGIGVVLWDIIRSFQYAETCAVLVIIVVTVTLLDVASARVRKLFI